MSEYQETSRLEFDRIWIETVEIRSILKGATQAPLGDPAAGLAFLEHISPHVAAIVAAMERWRKAAEEAL